MDSLATYWALGHRDLVVSVLGMLGEAEGQLGRLERAATLWGAAEALAEATGMATLPAGRADYERNVAEARARADAAAFDRAWAAGRLMSLEEAVGLALAPARCGDSETESAAGPHAGAADRDA